MDSKKNTEQTQESSGTEEIGNYYFVVDES